MNPLTDIIPSRYRKYVYALLSVVALVYGVWQQAANHDWQTLLGGLVAALVTGTAASNIHDSAD